MSVDVEIKTLQGRLDRLEEQYEKLEERQRNVEKDQAETRVYVKQILESIATLRVDVTTMFKEHKAEMAQQQHSQALQENAQVGQQERSQWMEFAKWIIGGTVFIIVAYFFGGKQ